MEILIFTAAVAIFLAAAPSLTETNGPSSCHGDVLNATLVKCMTENGFTMTQVMLIQSANGPINYNANTMEIYCANKDGYLKAMECVVDETDRCKLAADFPIINAMNQTSQIMGTICNDPKFKLDCLDMFTRDPLLLQLCLETNYDFIKELEVKTVSQVTCESGKVGVKCAVDALKFAMTTVQMYTLQYRFRSF